MNSQWWKKVTFICLVISGFVLLKWVVFGDYTETAATTNLFTIDQELYRNLDFEDKDAPNNSSSREEFMLSKFNSNEHNTKIVDSTKIVDRNDSIRSEDVGNKVDRSDSKWQDDEDKRQRVDRGDSRWLEDENKRHGVDRSDPSLSEDEDTRLELEKSEGMTSQGNEKLQTLRWKEEGNVRVDTDEVSLENSLWIYTEKNYSSPADDQTVRSLYWYDYVLKKQEGIVKMRGPSMSGCAHKCEYVTDPSLADMVLFNGYSLKVKPLTPDTVWTRPAHQEWIIATCDPVDRDNGLDDPFIKDKFNLTSTYRSDSDIPEYLGQLQKKTGPLPSRNYSEIFRKKSKLAAWFVSDCSTDSRREDYVRRMSKVASVDIYGRCGPYTCPLEMDSMAVDKCLSVLTDNYKFYLSFENALCDQYVTEKFFKLFEEGVHVVPVVRGGVDYDGVFPNGTLVNAANFQSPEDLMKYLIELGNDEKAYTTMLQAKDQWKYVRPEEEKIMCKICRHLHTRGTSRRYIANVADAIWHSPSTCWPPTDLGGKNM